MNDTNDNYQPCTKEFAFSNPRVSVWRKIGITNWAPMTSPPTGDVAGNEGKYEYCTLEEEYQPCTKEFALTNPDVSQARFYSQLESAWGDWDEVGDFAYDRDPNQYEFRTLKQCEADDIEPMTDPVFESSPDATVSISVGRKTLRDRVTDRIREVCPSPHEATNKDWVFALIDVLDGANETASSESLSVLVNHFSKMIGNNTINPITALSYRLEALIRILEHERSSRPIGKDRGIE